MTVKTIWLRLVAAAVAVVVVLAGLGGAAWALATWIGRLAATSDSPLLDEDVTSPSPTVTATVASSGPVVEATGADVMVFDPDGVGTVPEGYPLLPDDERAHAMCAAVTAFYSFDTVDGPVTWGERVDAARPYTVGSLADAIAYADPTGQVTARSTAIWPDVAAHADAYCFPTSYPTRFTSYHEDGALVARMSLLVRVDVTGQLGEQWTEVYQVANMAAASLSVDGSVTQTGRWMVVNWTPWPIAAGFEWTVLEGERYPFHP